jgi:hypothetical protein
MDEDEAFILYSTILKSLMNMMKNKMGRGKGEKVQT